MVLNLCLTGINLSGKFLTYRKENVTVSFDFCSTCVSHHHVSSFFSHQSSTWSRLKPRALVSHTEKDNVRWSTLNVKLLKDFTSWAHKDVVCSFSMFQPAKAGQYYFWKKTGFTVDFLYLVFDQKEKKTHRQQPPNPEATSRMQIYTRSVLLTELCIAQNKERIRTE